MSVSGYEREDQKVNYHLTELFAGRGRFLSLKRIYSHFCYSFAYL